MSRHTPERRNDNFPVVLTRVLVDKKRRIGGFWSHFRRMINGCYHDVSDEHLQLYIDEAVFRWDTRKMDESERFAHMFCKSIGLVIK